MLFISLEFMLFFLPIVLFIFWLLGSKGYPQAASVWLIILSLVFYAWWDVSNTAIIIFSIFFNYFIGMSIVKLEDFSKYKKAILVFGITVNIGLIGYYKYSTFILETIQKASGVELNIVSTTLPLAISFFTFQQIAYLIDTHKGQTGKGGFLSYALFVLFFPQLIAGPIVHHREMVPQFLKKTFSNLNFENVSKGLTLFTLGLFKKVIIADNVAKFSTPVFDAVSQSAVPGFFESWIAATAYSLQIYYDFSGYTDMALGLALFFSIQLPINFNSPYKATNISDFWRRWHITLSFFLRDYLYIPLGGNKKGPVRQSANLLTTMLLGGLWHGAGWTFIVWGGIHGVYLILNHLWRAFTFKKGWTEIKNASWYRWIARGVTLASVTLAWVFFRANNISDGLVIAKGMLGMNGYMVDEKFSEIPILSSILHLFPLDYGHFIVRETTMIIIPIILIATLVLPNSIQFVLPDKLAPADKRNANARSLIWTPQIRYALSFGLLFAIIVLNNSETSEFLYFQF